MDARWFLRAALSAAFLAAGVAPQTASPDGDPHNGEVALPAAPGWNAFLLHETEDGAGVWTVRSFQVFERYGCPEIVALDDSGRCTVLVSYSGKWTPNDSIDDGRWLAPVAHADVDPRHPGRELYTGGRSGTLYRIVVDADGELDGVEIAHWADEEIHTIVAADLRPARDGDELLVFMRKGTVHELRPQGDGHGFRAAPRAELPGRVRDALVLEPALGEAPWIVTVSRAGEVALMRLDGDELERRVILREPMGFGRVTRGRGAFADVLYVTRDDGLVLRLERGPDGASFSREVVYAGPQGLRGVVAGRFVADRRAESIAVFGYSAEVEVLSRLPGEPWQAETVFVDSDRGHWLTAAEVDGRNATDEIVASGYAGRIVLLSRPPGFGLSTDIPTAPEPKHRTRAAARIRRVAVKAGEIAATQLSPLRYQGGFETKTAVYETLVRRGEGGRIVPALASDWRFEDGGRRVVFTLREGATFHDGSPVTAAAVATHFRRWVGLPEHAWLRSNDHIVGVRAQGDRELCVELDEPRALLPDLCAINPCAIQGPAALDREGAFVRPVGSGPWRVAGVSGDRDRLRLARHGGPRDGALLDMVRLPKTDEHDPLDVLLAGDVDVVLGSWLVQVDPQRARRLEDDARFQVHSAPGSSVHYLSFALHRGPTTDPRVRRAVAGALDREALCRQVHAGFADPCTTWAAPAAAGIWPRSDDARTEQAAPPVDLPDGPLTLLIGEDQRLLADSVAAQLAAAGIAVEIDVADAATRSRRSQELDFDLRLERTWGLPYDPYLSLVARFATPVEGPTAASPRAYGVDAELRELVDRATLTPGQQARRASYAQIQQRMDRECLLVPLLVPRRIAVLRADLPGPELGPDIYRSDLTPWQSTGT